MICSGCFREVPDLVSPGEDLCADCYGIAAEHFMPSFSGMHPSHGSALLDGFFEKLARDVEAYARAVEEWKERDEWADEDWPDEPADFLTFQGAPRF